MNRIQVDLTRAKIEEARCNSELLKAQTAETQKPFWYRPKELFVFIASIASLFVAVYQVDQILLKRENERLKLEFGELEAEYSAAEDFIGYIKDWYRDIKKINERAARIIATEA